MSDTLAYQLAQEDVDVIPAALRLLQRTSGWDTPDAIQHIGGESLDVVNIEKPHGGLNPGGSLTLRSVDWADLLIGEILKSLSTYLPEIEFKFSPRC